MSKALTTISIFVTVLSFSAVAFAESSIQERFQKLAAEGAGRSGRAQAAFINQAVNLYLRAPRLTEKWENWPKVSETLERGYGDCKDYSILKYALLKSVGVPESRLRIAVLNILGRENHAVVEIEINGEWLVLDNLGNLTLAPLEARHNYKRLYSFRPENSLIDIFIHNVRPVSGSTDTASGSEMMRADGAR